jgi:hypothetical protein
MVANPLALSVRAFRSSGRTPASVPVPAFRSGMKSPKRPESRGNPGRFRSGSGCSGSSSGTEKTQDFCRIPAFRTFSPYRGFRNQERNPKALMNSRTGRKPLSMNYPDVAATSRQPPEPAAVLAHGATRRKVCPSAGEATRAPTDPVEPACDCAGGARSARTR